MRKILLISLLQLVVLVVFAESNVTMSSLDIREGRQAMLTINYEFDEGHTICNYQMEVQLPEGITVVGTSVTLGECHSAHTGSIVNNTAVVTSMNNVVNGTSGMLLKIPVKASEELVAGSQLQGTLHNIKLGQLDETSINPEDVSFTINIVEDILVLDENSYLFPEAEYNSNVRVKRTIQAGNWSTICLPFSMTEEQVKAAFGNEVQLGDFTGCEVNDVTGNISANFCDVTTIEANHPYIIKVSESIEEFTVDGVDITPEEEPVVNRDEETTCTSQNKRTTYNSFIGTFVAETIMPDYALFLNDNKFWFSTGKSKIDAFRGYFNFATAGAKYEEESFLARSTTLSFYNSETTEIKTFSKLPATDGVIYNINGQCVNRQVLPKGIYIKDNKKIFVK